MSLLKVLTCTNSDYRNIEYTVCTFKWQVRHFFLCHYQGWTELGAREAFPPRQLLIGNVGLVTMSGGTPLLRYQSESCLQSVLDARRYIATSSPFRSVITEIFLHQLPLRLWDVITKCRELQWKLPAGECETILFKYTHLSSFLTLIMLHYAWYTFWMPQKSTSTIKILVGCFCLSEQRSLVFPWSLYFILV